VAFAALALAPAGLRAQDGGEPALRLFETATVRARPLTSATASVTVLDREAIEATGAASVAELIRFVPGLDVTTSGPRGGFATAQIRGGDPNFTLVMVDGVPLNDLTDQVGGAVNLNSLSTRDVERIEIVRGPLSSSYGSVGLAGAINVITRRGAAGTGIEARVAAGDDSALQARVGGGRGDERRDHFVSAWWEREKDRVVRDDFEQLGLQGNARLPLARGELKLVGRVATWDSEDYPEASGGPTHGTGATRRSDHDEASLGAEWRTGSEALPQKVYLAAYRHELDRLSPEIPPGPSGFVPAFSERTEFTSLRLGWALSQLAAGSARIGLGVEVGVEDGESDATLALPAPFDDGSFAIDRALGGAFAEMLAERGRLLFELGARLDVPEGFDPELSPRAGIRWRAREATALRASAGRAFKLPSFFALGNPIVGNPDLVPETMLGADVGVDHSFRSCGVETSLTWFYNRYEDLVDFDFGTLQNVNASIDARGLELAASWSPTDEIRLLGNVTRQELDRDGSSAPVRNRPEWIGGARLVWRASTRLRLEVDGQWVSERDDEQIPTGPGTVAGYQLYGSSLGYTLGELWALRARADNLAGKDYEALIGFPGPDRSFLVELSRRH